MDVSSHRSADLTQRCRLLFETHRRFAFGGVFHVPDVAAYPELFAWDSGYHALALRHLDPHLALEELRTLYRANQAEDGQLAHQRPLPDDPGRVEEMTRRFGPLYRDSGASWLVDPPVAAYAAARLAATDASALDLLESATRHLDALAERRVLAEGGLPVVLHPFESGTEGTPLTDDLLDVSSPRAYVACLRELTESAVACGFDPRSALRSGHGFVVEDPVFCGWYLLALEEVAAAWGAYGETDTASRLMRRARETARLVSERLWWEEAELVAGYDVGRDRPLRAITAGGLVAAASRTLLAEGTARLTIERYLCSDTSPLWGPRGISFNPVDPTLPARGSRYWRGNVVWAASMWWAHLALVRAGELQRARRTRLQLEQLIDGQGFREHYDAVTGEGGGAGADQGFTWPALVLDMAAREESTP